MNEYKIYQVKREHMREYGFCGLRQILWQHPGMQGLPREVWEPKFRETVRDLHGIVQAALQIDYAEKGGTE